MKIEKNEPVITYTLTLIDDEAFDLEMLMSRVSSGECLTNEDRKLAKDLDRALESCRVQ